MDADAFEEYRMRRAGEFNTLEERTQYFCGGCRRYMAMVPDIGARLGHVMDNWCVLLDNTLTLTPHLTQVGVLYRG